MKLGYIAFCMLGLAFTTACASQPNQIAPTYVSPMVYRDYDCEQIFLEQNRIERRTGELYSSLKKEANADSWQMGVGIVLFWPTLFMLEGGDGPEAIEYARLRGEYEALTGISIRKKCELEFQADLGEVIRQSNPYAGIRR